MLQSVELMAAGAVDRCDQKQRVGVLWIAAAALQNGVVIEMQSLAKSRIVNEIGVQLDHHVRLACEQPLVFRIVGAGAISDFLPQKTLGGEGPAGLGAVGGMDEDVDIGKPAQRRVGIDSSREDRALDDKRAQAAPVKRGKEAVAVMRQQERKTGRAGELRPRVGQSFGEAGIGRNRRDQRGEIAKRCGKHALKSRMSEQRGGLRPRRIAGGARRQGGGIREGDQPGAGGT